jgi:2,4-dienoyl-CoA reductase-like NADH-dependent reductase (Old Yellow Enzyme family)
VLLKRLSITWWDVSKSHPPVARKAAAANPSELGGGGRDDVPQFTEEFRQAIRARFTRQIIVAGKYDKVRAEWVLSKGYADLVAFGRPFVANPDLHVDSPRACR